MQQLRPLPVDSVDGSCYVFFYASKVKTDQISLILIFHLHDSHCQIFVLIYTNNTDALQRDYYSVLIKTDMFMFQCYSSHNDLFPLLSPLLCEYTLDFTNYK